MNDQIQNQLRRVRQDARLVPALAAVKEAKQVPGATSKEVYAAAIRASRDSFIREGARALDDEVRERALLLASVAAVDSQVSLADLPHGADKTRHAFLSGWLSLKIARAADVVLPRWVAEKVGIVGSFALGFLKEVYDMVFATGFSRADLVADWSGARLPFSRGART
ncbi:MAG: hypothetical protein VKN33_08820 [Candidatus Sericytochromatia bacterium]|nr:hypothetical protein [Candidatus Sericytochromatia bacterium]